MQSISIGYIGQRRSGVNKQYLLGNGYRGFNPLLKRFAGQDSLSPFDAGGPHGYSYCEGDSTNQSDSNGRGPFIDLIMLVEIGAVRGTVRALEADCSIKVVEDAVADTAGVVSRRINGSLRIYSTEGFSMTETEARSMASEFIDGYARAAGYEVSELSWEEGGITRTRKVINVKGKWRNYYAKPRFNTLGQLYKLDIYTENHVRLTKKMTGYLSKYMNRFEYVRTSRFKRAEHIRLYNITQAQAWERSPLPGDPDEARLRNMLSVLESSSNIYQAL